MAAVDSGRSVMDPQLESQNGVYYRLKKLYPAVDQRLTPLPRSWSPKDKYGYIGLSQNNLRVHYKGHGKTHRDAASVQAMHPIPASCGLYYFEVRIISKGRDGYMGIGLSAHGVNMNRLPGWDKQSYGYHGDDGHSFCSSGTGQPYGPTFTTGDVIGCGVNLIDNTVFYTKNGHHLGIAFRDIPQNLYPTVGLQTPGEVVDANFGQEPFVFDIEDMMKELRSRIRTEIYLYPVPDKQAEWQGMLNRMVSTYLVHHGFCNTAESFAHITEQPFNEDTVSIKNRQRVLKLVLAGRISEAIDKTNRLYPGLLENNPNLLFQLKCRQFIEMIIGCDVDVQRKKSVGNCNSASPRPGSPVQTSVIQSTKSLKGKSVEEMNRSNAARNGKCDGAVIGNEDCDVEMDTSDEVQNGHGDNCMNGKSNNSNNGYQNGSSNSLDNTTNTKDDIKNTCCDTDEENMEIDLPYRRSCQKEPVERILQFGKELYTMSQRLKGDKLSSSQNEKMLENAFSLLAYSNPWASPVGWQLNSSQRDYVCASLNSAILDSNNKPRKPPLEVAIAHAEELLRLMSNAGLGSCAFASLVDLLDQ